jgi:hypothetical protein
MIVLLPLLFVWSMPVQAADPSHRHEAGQSCGMAETERTTAPAFEGVQLETRDIEPHELLFESILKARTVFKIDHPQVDHLRGYCLRDVLIVLRQDLKTPRPTGWVQVNFAVPDAAKIKEELEQALQASPIGHRPVPDREKVVRIRLKPDVPRSNCRAMRLEVAGPEGFMLGFDQFKPGTCTPSIPGEQLKEARDEAQR